MKQKKHEKHVSIDDPSPTLSSGRSNHEGHETPRNGNTTPRRGALPVPKHMLSPGQDGYRTPTIEDYEMHSCGPTPHFRDVESSNHTLHFQMPQLSPGHANRHSLNSSNGNMTLHILEKLQWRERIRHYTWTFFTLTMATGGIANVLYEGRMKSGGSFGDLEADRADIVPFRFPGLTTVGIVFFLLNILLFIINIIMISLRFYCYPETFRASILHPTERLFIPAAVVSFGTILLNISQYGPSHAGYWLNEAVTVCFWVDAALAVLSSMGVYLVM